MTTTDDGGPGSEREWKWDRTRRLADDGVDEWTRRDGLATVRLRERADGGFVVRYDRLEQADDGRAYRRERVTGARRAREVAATWRD